MEHNHMNERKRLYRSLNDRMIGGVCGGFAEYFSIDSTIVRIVWLFFTFFGGIGFLLYLACLILMRENPDQSVPENPKDKNVGLIVGAALIMFGLTFLSANWDMFPFNPYKLHFFRPWFFHWNGLFPLLIIGVGVYYIYHVLSKEKETDDHASATNAVHRRFYRSKSDRMIGGVCGGIANYFEIDSVLVRLFWVFVTLFSGFLLGVIAYIVILVVIPEADVEAESAEVHPKK